MRSQGEQAAVAASQIQWGCPSSGELDSLERGGGWPLPSAMGVGTYGVGTYGATQLDPGRNSETVRKQVG